MRIVIASADKTLDSLIDSSIGRANYFIIYDIVIDKYVALPNPFIDSFDSVEANVSHLLLEQNISAMISSACSEYTHNYLSANNVAVITGVKGTVKKAVEDYKKGLLKPVSYKPYKRGMRGAKRCRYGQKGFFSEVNTYLDTGTDTTSIKCLKETVFSLSQQLKNVQKKLDDMEKKGGCK